jgi:hypothetical protein
MRHTEIHNGINNYKIIVNATLRLALSTLKDCLLHTSMPACVRNGIVALSRFDHVVINSVDVVNGSSSRFHDEVMNSVTMCAAATQRTL